MGTLAQKAKGVIMKTTGTVGICTLVAYVLGAAAVVHAAERATPRPEYVIGEEEAWTVLADEPQQHFQAAHEAFVKKDLKAAAVEIRKGAAFLRLEAARVTGASKDVLAASIKELDSLAGKVESGRVTAASDLDHAFARAEHALASAYLARATESWAKKDVKRAGHALKAAATSLEHALAWAGRKGEAGVIAVTTDAGVVAERLIAGTGWAADETGKALEAVGTEIDKLGRALSLHERLGGVAGVTALTMDWARSAQTKSRQAS
jgi:hypothetical protein